MYKIFNRRFKAGTVITLKNGGNEKLTIKAISTNRLLINANEITGKAFKRDEIKTYSNRK